MSEPVLDVSGLRVTFRSRRSSVTALRDVAFTLHAGRTLALVGESSPRVVLGAIFLITALLGMFIVGFVGFAHIDAVHNAGHDYRHSMAFPCH